MTVRALFIMMVLLNLQLLVLVLMLLGLAWANVAGNVSVTRSLAVGYTDGRVPQANLDVKGNVYIDGNTHVRINKVWYFWQWYGYQT